MTIKKPTEEVVELNKLILIGPQRPLIHSHPALAGVYDPALAGYLLVSRREDGTLALIDGQHRKESAIRSGETEHLALVYDGLTREEEAHLFFQHNTSRVGMNALLKFNSAVEAGYPEQVEIRDIVLAMGGRVNVSANALGINAVSMLERIYRNRGAEGLRRVLTIIKDAWPDYHFSVPASSSAMLGGLAYFEAMHIDERGVGSKVDYGKLIKKLDKVGPEDISRRGDGIYSVRKATKESAFYYALVDTYNHGARNGNRIDEGKPSWKTVTIKECIVPDCDNKSKSRGMCNSHYALWYREAIERNHGVLPPLDEEDKKAA